VFDRVKAQELRREDLSIAKIAAQIGVSGPTILTALRESQVALTAPPSLTAVQQDVISALVNLKCRRPDAEMAVRGANGEDFETLFKAALQTLRCVA
jgi:hypothetical protein